MSLHQVHRITNIILSALENKVHCEGVFLDIAQAFDRVWHEGLLYKIKFLPAPLYLIFKSFLSHAVCCEDVLSNTYLIKAGVLQGSTLAPTLFNVFTSNILHSNVTFLITFADDTVLISSDPNLIQASENF